MKKEKLKKQEEEEMDYEEEEEEEEEKGMGYKAKKSEELSEDDLEKSIEKLEELAESEPASRKEILLSKAQEGELEKSEREELYSLLGGEPERPESTLAEDIAKGMVENEDLQKALDVSDYLQANQDELQKSLSLLADHIEKSDKRQHDFNLLLSKSVALIGRQVMGLAEQFNTYGEQPARAPKSRGVQSLEKGFAGQAPQGEQLAKSEIMNTMMAMAEDCSRHGRGTALEDGTDLAMAITKYEQTNAISPDLLSKVKAFRKTA